MKRFAVSAVALAVMSPAALAHPGDHGFAAFSQTLFHLVTEPDHLAMIAAAVGLAIYIVRRRNKAA